MRILELRRSVGWLTGAATLTLLANCGGSSLDTTGGSCAKDSDCATGQRCQKPISSPTKGTIPCPGSRPCTSAAECAAGEVCAPEWQVSPDLAACQPLLCGAPCTATSCPADARCLDTGVCELLPCSEDPSLCPDHWRCDPEAATTESIDYSFGSVTPEPDIGRSIAHGCVRRQCDEDDGYECAELYACDPGSSTDGSGCAPQSCTETGECLDPEYQVCLSASKHPDFSPDAHGCVPRGCDEGYSCSLISARGVEIGYCDYSAPNAEPTTGCAIRQCTSDADCADFQKCDSTGAFVDGQGCRDLTCVEGLACLPGWACDPTRTADYTGCVDPSMGVGGAGGTSSTSTGGIGGATSATGGTGGTGGTTTGGSGGSDASGTGGSTGGSAGTSSRDGQCVER